MGPSTMGAWYVPLKKRLLTDEVRFPATRALGLVLMLSASLPQSYQRDTVLYRCRKFSNMVLSGKTECQSSP